MSIVVRFAPSGTTAEQYDEVFRRMSESDWPPDGLDYHVAFGPSSDLRVSEIWDSREKWEAFLGRLMPVLSEAGIDVSSEPEVFEVHNVVKR